MCNDEFLKDLVCAECELINDLIGKFVLTKLTTFYYYYIVEVGLFVIHAIVYEILILF